MPEEDGFTVSELETAIRVSPDMGLRGMVFRDHLRLEATRPRTNSRKEALHFWMRDLDPLLDTDFWTAYKTLMDEVDKMLLSGNPKASSHYEEMLHRLLRGVEYRAGLDGDKSLEYADDR